MTFVDNKEQLNSGMFENCISLGWFCGTASAMGKLGLRSFSGPFDWILSDYQQVLRMIETDFADLLMKDNLRLLADNPKAFEDTKYGFIYFHDIKVDFEREYEQIAEKYRRRCRQFMSASQNPTCYLRIVRSVNEIKYIEENQEYIERVIKKSNSLNQVFYLVIDGMNFSTEIRSPYYKINVKDFNCDFFEGRDMFDTSYEWLKVCNTLISKEKMKKNQEFDENSLSERKKSAFVIKYVKQGSELFYCTLNKLISLTEGLYIWGAGDYGIPVTKYLVSRGIKIPGVIDNNVHRQNTKICGINIISCEKIKRNLPIFIAVGAKDKIDEIKNQIKTMDEKQQVITFLDIYDNMEE